MVYTLADGTQMTRRKRIPVTGAASGAQTDFQIKLDALAYAAAMQNDFDDLRFVKADMQTLIDAWLETKTDDTSADVWTEFPTTPANGVTEDYWMYYGNAGAASDWDIGATFVFGDHFEGSSIDTNKWADAGGNAVANSEVTFTGTAVYTQGIRSVSNFSRPAVVESRVSCATGADASMFFIKNTDASQWYDEFYSGIYFATVLQEHSVYETGTGYYNKGSYNDETYYTYKHILTPTALISVYQNDVSIWAGSKSSSADFKLAYSGKATSEFKVDWVFIRKYAASPPTAALGSEEHQRRTPQFM